MGAGREEGRGSPGTLSVLPLQGQAGSQPLPSLYLLSPLRDLSNLAQERCHPAGV